MMASKFLSQYLYRVRYPVQKRAISDVRYLRNRIKWAFVFINCTRYSPIWYPVQNKKGGVHMKVLLIDDDKLVCSSLKIILSADPDIEVVGMGHSGTEAITLYKSLRPDLL